MPKNLQEDVKAQKIYGGPNKWLERPNKWIKGSLNRYKIAYFKILERGG